MTTATVQAPQRAIYASALPVVTRHGAGQRARNVRSDALPEHMDYRDDGCDLFPSCLSCPLARCRYDVPGGVRALLNQERDHQIRVLREDAGLSVDEIAERFQVSRRTVFRALSTAGATCRPDGRGQRRGAQ
ncbi:MAG: helix-turn-helix domain-containing protein [Dehalococcoidia bacterium]|nr:helix-turn-helix domain-containing protein [Dehalococcoidia bacterium]